MINGPTPIQIGLKPFFATCAIAKSIERRPSEDSLGRVEVGSAFRYIGEVVSDDRCSISCCTTSGSCVRRYISVPKVCLRSYARFPTIPTFAHAR